MVAALLFTACGVGSPASPTQTTSSVAGSPGAGTAKACSTTVGAGATAYPGWPGAGQVTTTSTFIPYLVSSELSIGPNRVLMTIIDQQNKNIASADAKLELAFYDLASDPSAPVSQADAEFLDTGTPAAGFYHAMTTFPCWGDWGVQATFTQPNGTPGTTRVVFDVEANSSTPAIGAAAPPADSPTATDAAGIARISTDTTPDADDYRMTITQAEQAGKPAVIVFATPAFCRTATCGPTLDRVQAVSAPYKPKVNIVHVEPYILQQTSTGLQPVLDEQGNLQVVPSAITFGLPSEPYTFVLDSGGRVAFKFDGVMGEDELRAALDSVTTGSPLGSLPVPSLQAAPTETGGPVGGPPWTDTEAEECSDLVSSSAFWQLTNYWLGDIRPPDKVGVGDREYVTNIVRFFTYSPGPRAVSTAAWNAFVEASTTAQALFAQPMTPQQFADGWRPLLASAEEVSRQCAVVITWANQNLPH